MKIKYLDTLSLAGEQVRVYRNLHCKDRRLYSVQMHYEGLGWRVIGHETVLFLKDVVFSVNEPSRQRVLRNKSKNVHAYIYGTVMLAWNYPDLAGEPVSYNPYECSTFYSVDKKNRVLRGDYCSIDSEGVLVYR